MLITPFLKHYKLKYSITQNDLPCTQVDRSQQSAVQLSAVKALCKLVAVAEITALCGLVGPRSGLEQLSHRIRAFLFIYSLYLVFHF